MLPMLNYNNSHDLKLFTYSMLYNNVNVEQIFNIEFIHLNGHAISYEKLFKKLIILYIFTF